MVGPNFVVSNWYPNFEPPQMFQTWSYNLDTYGHKNLIFFCLQMKFQVYQDSVSLQIDVRFLESYWQIQISSTYPPTSSRRQTILLGWQRLFPPKKIDVFLPVLGFHLAQLGNVLSCTPTNSCIEVRPIRLGWMVANHLVGVTFPIGSMGPIYIYLPAPSRIPVVNFFTLRDGIIDTFFLGIIWHPLEGPGKFSRFL